MLKSKSYIILSLGRWPVNAVKVVLGLLDNLTANAQVKPNRIKIWGIIKYINYISQRHWTLPTLSLIMVKLIELKREEEEPTEPTEELDVRNFE